MPGVPPYLQCAGEFLQVEGWEVTPEVAVFECEALLERGGEERGLTGEAGGDTVAAGVFGSDAEAEGRCGLPVEHQGTAAEGARGVVGVVEAVADEGERMALGGGFLAEGKGGCQKQQEEGERGVFHFLGVGKGVCWIKGIFAVIGWRGSAFVRVVRGCFRGDSR